VHSASAMTVIIKTVGRGHWDQTGDDSAFKRWMMVMCLQSTLLTFCHKWGRVLT